MKKILSNCCLLSSVWDHRHQKLGILTLPLEILIIAIKAKDASMLDLTYGFTENKTSSFLGEIVPVFGAFVTADSAAMLYVRSKNRL